MQTLDGLCVISSLCRNDCGLSTVTAALRANLVCTEPSGRRATVAICREFECSVKCVSRPLLRGNEITQYAIVSQGDVEESNNEIMIMKKSHDA